MSPPDFSKRFQHTAACQLALSDERKGPFLWRCPGAMKLVAMQLKIEKILLTSQVHKRNM
jgi:hypothetical protein